MDYIHLLIVRKTCFMATIFVNVCVFFLGGGERTGEHWTNKLAGCSALACSPAIYCNIICQWKIIITSQYNWRWRGGFLMDVVHPASFNLKLYRKTTCERQMSKQHMIFLFIIPAYVYISPFLMYQDYVCSNVYVITDIYIYIYMRYIIHPENIVNLCFGPMPAHVPTTCWNIQHLCLT